MEKQLHIAVLFCILLILFSGCSKTEPEATKNDNIRISNLKTADMSLSQEEKEYMDAVCSILNATQLLPVKGVDYQANVVAHNTSGNDLDLYIYVCGYGEDGQLLYSESHWIDDWEAGQKLDYELYTGTRTGIVEYRGIGMFRFNNSWYMTDPVPLPMPDGNKELNITLQYADSLPAVVRMEQSWDKPITYSLLDFSIKQDYSDTAYSLTLLVRKESGENNNSDEIPIRILDKDGSVHYSGSVYTYLSCGETAQITQTIYIYEQGEYYLELR